MTPMDERSGKVNGMREGEGAKKGKRDEKRYLHGYFWTTKRFSFSFDLALCVSELLVFRI